MSADVRRIKASFVPVVTSAGATVYFNQANIVSCTVYQTPFPPAEGGKPEWCLEVLTVEGGDPHRFFYGNERVAHEQRMKLTQ